MANFYLSVPSVFAINRKEHDEYHTPYSIADYVMGNLPEEVKLDGGIAIDAGAGFGVWGQALKNHHKDFNLIGYDIQDKFVKPDAYDEWNIQDYRQVTFDKPNLILGNPPFKYSEDLITKAKNELADGGWCILLLRSDYPNTIRRHKKFFGGDFCPVVEASFPSRMPFIPGETKCFPQLFSMFFWQKGYSESSWRKYSYPPLVSTW